MARDLFNTCPAMKTLKMLGCIVIKRVDDLLKDAQSVIETVVLEDGFV
jgi:hypothetical protein